MSDRPPRKRSRKVAPPDRKARDRARQRKIAANGSDKAARRTAPRIKAMANRTARRVIETALKADPLAVSRAEIAAVQRRRPRHWGSDNAALRRSAMAGERAWLDANPPAGCPGRRRYGWDQARRRLGLPEGYTQQQYLIDVMAPRPPSGRDR